MKITPIDEDRAADGTWTDYMDVPLLIARANNDKFRKIFRRLSKPHANAIEKNRLNDDIAQKILCRAMAEAILVGWKQEQFPGNLEYSVDTAEQLLLDDMDCRDFVYEFSKEAENFYVTEIEERVGN